jgi:hypothetical protein
MIPEGLGRECGLESSLEQVNEPSIFPGGRAV